MDKTPSRLRAKVVVSVGDGEYTELGEFDIPVIMRMAPVTTTPNEIALTFDVPDLVPAVARALREIADRIDPVKVPRGAGRG